MNYPKVASQVIEMLGGKNNIKALAHCSTRLRLAIEDESLINEKPSTMSKVLKVNLKSQVSIRLCLVQVS